MLAAPPPSLAGIARASTQRGQHWDDESADPGAGDLDGCGPGAPRPSSSRPSTPRSIADDGHQGRMPRADPKATSGGTFQIRETIMETQRLPTQRTDAQGCGRQGEDPPPDDPPKEGTTPRPETSDALPPPSGPPRRGPTGTPPPNEAGKEATQHPGDPDSRPHSHLAAVLGTAMWSMKVASCGP